MKTLYLDCFSGASGDMLLGSLFDLGLNRTQWMREMKGLGLPEKWSLRFSKEERLLEFFFFSLLRPRS
ncbi:MAG: nickel insertion protein [Verrucomicrobiota bacterium]